MRVYKVCFAAVILITAFSVSASTFNQLIEDPTAVWSTWGGEGTLELNAEYLGDFGLEVIVDGELKSVRVSEDLIIQNLGSLSLLVPQGNFESFKDGQLSLTTNVVLRHGHRVVSLEQLVATGAKFDRNAAIHLADGQGRHLLTLTHLHVLAEQDEQILTIHNADVRATPQLAELLDLPVLVDVPLGMAWIDLNLHIPPGADLSGKSPDSRGLSCTGRPFWPQDDPTHIVDVGLINIGTVAYQNRQPGTNRIKVAPSATLKSFGFGDAVWIPKFQSRLFYSFSPQDQHPFLVWNMYRIADGRIQQLGSSGVKHAFLTINSNCTIDCGSGNVLWPGCEDVYSSGTNNSNFNQGPREDVLPAEGLFFSAGSFFDPDRTGDQTNDSTTWQNRLMVDENELQTPDATYFLDSWYVVQYDIDIWNSMGFHEINPSPSGNGWSFGPLGPFTEGPVLDQWIEFGSMSPLQAHESIVVASETPDAPYPGNMPQGHLRVLVDAIETSPGVWRYNYAIQNFDFTRAINQLRIPLPDSAQLFDTFFYSPEVDGVVGDDWTVSRDNDQLVFDAPANNHLRWFSLYNFEIETNAVPGSDEVRLIPAQAGFPSELSVEIIVPGLAEDIFSDGFET